LDRFFLSFVLLENLGPLFSYPSLLHPVITVSFFFQRRGFRLGTFRSFLNNAKLSRLPSLFFFQESQFHPPTKKSRKSPRGPRIETWSSSSSSLFVKVTVFSHACPRFVFFCSGGYDPSSFLSSFLSNSQYCRTPSLQEMKAASGPLPFKHPPSLSRWPSGKQFFSLTFPAVFHVSCSPAGKAFLFMRYQGASTVSCSLDGWGPCTGSTAHGPPVFFFLIVDDQWRLLPFSPPRTALVSLWRNQAPPMSGLLVLETQVFLSLFVPTSLFPPSR